LQVIKPKKIKELNMIRKTQSSPHPGEILIVEDSLTQAEHLKFMLETRNYISKVVSDGERALQWIKTNKPAVIISDILMPGLDGFQLCKKIKSEESTSRIPVILVTSLTSTEEVLNGLIAGADLILTKPFNDEHLFRCINDILSRQALKTYEEPVSVLLDYGDKTKKISTDPQKVVNLLLNIYQGAIYQNNRLEQMRAEQKSFNERLETIVKERTYALEKEIILNDEITVRLRESEAKYRNIVETANEGIWKTDAANNILFVNEKMALITGYRPDELIGHNILEFMDDEAKAIAERNLQQKSIESKVSYEQPFTRKGGVRIITYLNVAPLEDSQGTFKGSIGLLTDITERKKVERDLRESREKLNLALENGDIGTWEWNLKSDEVYCGKHFLKMFDLGTGSKGISIQQFEKLFMEEDRLRVMDSIRESVLNGSHCETRFRRNPADGRIRHFSLKAQVNKNPEDIPDRVIGVCLDITKLQEDNDKIADLNQKLLSSNKELERFAYVASHDLQEPLRMVSSFTQLLEKQYGEKLDDRAREYINFAVDGAHRMYNLINGLLAYSRVQRKGSTFTTVDTGKVIDSVKRLLSMQINESRAVIKTEKLPQIQADESQVSQLFLNLISNALKFNKEAPQILIAATTGKDKYVFSVKDNGIGIERQYFEKIFGIFNKLHPGNEYEGTGIGLSICKSIVEKHGGTIWVESELGKGTCFYFAIPR